MADVVDVVAWMVRMRPTDRGEVGTHDEVMYCLKASLVHSHCHLMLIWSKPNL